MTSNVLNSTYVMFVVLKEEATIFTPIFTGTVHLSRRYRPTDERHVVIRCGLILLYHITATRISDGIYY